jgi:hypothetical protein
MTCTSSPMQSSQLEFQRLFVENQRRIFGYILTLAPSSDDAQEIFQNTCVEAVSQPFKSCLEKLRPADRALIETRYRRDVTGA